MAERWAPSGTLWRREGPMLTPLRCRARRVDELVARFDVPEDPAGEVDVVALVVGRRGPAQDRSGHG